MEPNNKFITNNIGAIHILYIRGDGQKIQRNANAALLEKFWATYFYGPLWIVFSSTSHPPQLVDWNPEDLIDLPFNRTPDNKLIKWLMEMSEFNRDLEEYQSKLSTYAFAMFRYKTSWWPKITQKHDWAQWIYAHRLQDFRRPPDIYEYSSDDWTIIIHKDWSWEGWPDGLFWKYSHTTFERLYHPSKFKLVPCEKKVWNRDEMWAFYHKPEEKHKVEQESEAFFDPLIDYDEGEYDQEVETPQKRVSEPKESLSDKPIPNTNTNIIPELIVNDNVIQPEHTNSFPSSNKMLFEECNEENMWANSELELEAILQKTKSQTQKVDFEAIALDRESPKLLNSSIKIQEKWNSDAANTPKSKEAKPAKRIKSVSCEIKNIVLGNGQKIETAKIIENICALAPSSSKSKFFDNCNEDRIEGEDDLINDIFGMDYDTFCRNNEGKITKSAIQNNSLLCEDNNALHVIHEEVETWDSNWSEKTLNQHLYRHI